MNKRSRIIVSVVGITIVLLALLGLTYAYYLTRIQGNTNTNSISVTTADLRLVYRDGSANVVETNIEPSNTVYEKQFTVTNEGNVNIDYGVYLIDVINTFERKDDIKYTMSCITDGTSPCGAVASETTFPSGISELSTATIEPNKTHTYTFKFTYKDTGTDQSVDMGKELGGKIQIFGENNNGLIIPYETNTLAYSMVNGASNSLNGTTLDLTAATQAKVANQVSTSTYGKTNPNVYPQERSSATNYYIAYACDYSINASGQFTLGTDACPVTITTSKYTNSAEMISALKGKYAMWGTGTNINTTNQSSLYKISNKDADFEQAKFKYISVNKYVSTEKVMATTQDDYGTSYYYRGGVENNYVTFANMCWRIVRVQGDGSVKLILEDQSEPCSENMDGNWNIPVSNAEGASTTGNFGYTEDATTYQYFFNYLNKDGKATSYDNSLGTALKNFQTNKLGSYLDDLKSGDWCFADNAYTSENVDVTTTAPLTEAEKKALASNYNSYYYDSYVRLYGNNPKQPTYKCNGTKMNTWADNTEMYVGGITADEIVYAGADTNWTENYAYYLLNDYQRGKSLYWWALSPNGFDGSGADAFIVDSDGYLSSYVVSYYGAFRPAVSLKSSTTIVAGGEGTLSNPYVVG